MRNTIMRLLARLSVGKKLLLIYLLDLTAVIFISGILINEKYIAIDFARDELRGNAYVAVLRDAVIDVALAATHPPGDRVAHHAVALAAAEARLGNGLDSAQLSSALGKIAGSIDAAPAERDKTIATGLARGRDLATRIGNQSKLILDPDLDSYYTMSLAVLRYPELLELVHGIGSLLHEAIPTAKKAESDGRTRYLILEGRLDAVAKGIESDFGEAVGGGGAPVRAALAPGQEKLAAAIEAFRISARGVIDGGRSRTRLDSVDAASFALSGQLRDTWRDAGIELDRLLNARIDGLFSRMWLHLGTAAFLLCAILTMVYFVARQIALPLRHLSSVTDTVGRTGNYSLRAKWESKDEIGRLVVGFNSMLDKLDRDRETQKELAANTRAAAAQQALVEATPIPMVVTAIPGHEVLHANQPADQWLNGCRTDPWAVGLAPNVRARFFQQIADHDAVNEYEVHWMGGREPAWAVLSACRMSYQGQDAILTVFTPINHLKLMEQRLELWAKVFEASSEGIMIINSEDRIMTVNQAFVRTTGYDFHDVVGERPDFLVPGPVETALFQRLKESARQRGAWQGEIELRRRNGGMLPVWLMVSVVRESQGAPEYYICTSIDITDRKKSEARIQFLAHHDVLTELPNRSLCIERLSMAMQSAERAGQDVAVLFIDLDRFKYINDSLGHHVGDGLLRSVARRLLEAVRGQDTVSRLGGDEFVVILNGVADAAEARRVVEQRLIPLIRKPHEVEGAELNVSCSVGIAMYPHDATDIDQLMRLADVAMYHSKANGRNAAHFYGREMTERAQTRLHLESRLRHAIERGELSLHYQPRVASHQCRLAGVEGLLRWHNADLGSVSPADFIPIAEETGLIVPIGNWVIEEACAQIARWRATGRSSFEVSINLSPLQLRDDRLPAAVADCMARHGVQRGELEIEITESALMENMVMILPRITEIRKLGVGLAIDDFGTGYSSLNYLSRLPLDKLKIDRSFIQHMEGDPANLAITRAIIGLGHTLGLVVVAEGVETEEQAAMLRKAGCDEFQGFLYSRPIPAADLTEWIDKRVLPVTEPVLRTA
jgi:diguanylate cyclase (GGDEF)-like protein/PAS domain S-box-containing protein